MLATEWMFVTQDRTESSGLPITAAIQPVGTSQLIFPAKNPNSTRHVFLHKLKHTNGARDRLFPNSAVKMSNGACSLMTRDTCCNNRMRPNTLFWWLKSYSSDCAFRRPRPSGLTFTWWGCWGHKPTELAHSFLVCSYVYICVYGPFNCILFLTFSRQLSGFSMWNVWTVPWHRLTRLVVLSR